MKPSVTAVSARGLRGCPVVVRVPRGRIRGEGPGTHGSALRSWAGLRCRHRNTLWTAAAVMASVVWPVSCGHGVVTPYFCLLLGSPSLELPGPEEHSLETAGQETFPGEVPVLVVDLARVGA